MNEKSRPAYDVFHPMDATRSPLAARFADQIVAVTEPFLRKPPSAWHVLDVGSGYGATTMELGRRCARAHGIEPTTMLHQRATEEAALAALENVTFEQGGVEELTAVETYDLVVLDNVYEHICDQRDALDRVHRALKPGGVAFILTPNKWWPIEAHYRLPLLSYLPVPVANRYLKMTRRGTDYTDASFAPSYRSLRRDAALSGLRPNFVLPGRDLTTMAGNPVHYRLGITAIRIWPLLWAVSKALMVVMVKPDGIAPGTRARGRQREGGGNRDVSQD